MSEVEPRRSVRATKGQHTKAFDELEQLPAAKKRQNKKTKKIQEQEQSQEPEEPEEIIRCVCGATEQDEDSGEAWISCETCYAWQHNVCVGVSSFEDEIPDNYWCEQCKPEDHKELLEAMKGGEKPWEARRKAHEEKKKKKGGRKNRGKRNSEQPEKVEKEREKTPKAKAKSSPAPEAAKVKENARAKASPAPEAPKVKETAKAKRKLREDSHVSEGKPSKIRRVSVEPTPTPTPAPASAKAAAPPVPVSEPASPPDPEPVPAAVSAPTGPKYTPPDNLPTNIKELPGLRKGPALALKKSILHVMTDMAKNNRLPIPEGSTVDTMAELSALQIERAVADTHPVGKGQKEYNQQIKSLTFNIKNNPELVHGLMDGTHTPPTLAVMTTDQLASSELQRQTAEMQAKVDKQSILPSQDQSGPRVRRTHKGDELVEDESMVNSTDEPPPLPPAGGGPKPTLKDRPIKNETETESPAHQRSPSQSSFDIGKVFSAVRSPSLAHPRRPSAPAPLATVDPDVDRMLEDENDSPPYSPTEEASDPSVVWRGNLTMSSIADFPAIARHIGGADFSSLGPWTKLIPPRMVVAGRIPQQSAIEYLCGLRYSAATDVIVVSLEPLPHLPRDQFHAMINYFLNKKRYGVVGDKVAGNVRDTYLVPVPAGEDNHPEFMLNLVDNHIPRIRTEPMMLAVFVYRNDPATLKLSNPPTPSNPRTSFSAPAVSPATPHQTPVPIPQIPQNSEESRKAAQTAGEAMAASILGPLISAPSVQMILPQAWKMSRKEWEVIRGLFEREPRCREDLTFLGVLLEREGRQ